MGVMKQLPKNQFDNVVRAIKRVDVERLSQLQKILEGAKDRLGFRVGKISAVSGVPAGSDQFDAGSIRDWAERVQPEDVEAIAQLKQLLATLWARLAG